MVLGLRYSKEVEVKVIEGNRAKNLDVKGTFSRLFEPLYRRYIAIRTLQVLAYAKSEPALKTIGMCNFRSVLLRDATKFSKFLGSPPSKHHHQNM